MKNEIKFHELLKCLEPYIAFEKYCSERSESKIYKVKLEASYESLPEEPLDDKILLRHAEDFTDLLKRAMEKALAFKMIEDHKDSLIERPSIADHERNRESPSWTYIVDLARNSFDVAMEKNKPLAESLLKEWRLYPYPVFYRLILYAITKHPNLDENIAIDLLKNKENHILWSLCCKREVFEYLKKRKHSKERGEVLINLIMEGPLRDAYKGDIDEERFEYLKNKGIYQRLHCLKKANLEFPEKIERYYDQVRLSLGERADDDLGGFASRIEVFWVADYSKSYNDLSVEEIYNDIKDGSPNDYLESQSNEMQKGNKGDNFCQLVIFSPEKAFEVLLKFLDENENKAFYWGFFLGNILSTKKEIENDFSLKILEELKKFDDSLIENCLRPFISVFKHFCIYLYSKDKQAFINLWKKLWEMALKQDSQSFEDPSLGALNNSLGMLSECIFLVLWDQFPEIPENEKIPEEIRNYFKIIIEEGGQKDSSIFFHFGVYLYNLWYLDKQWIEENIKPLMDWDKDKVIYQSLWEGYSKNPRLGSGFLSDFKDKFYQLFLNKENFIDKNWLIPELLFITTGEKWTENIFTEKETKEIKMLIDKPILESISMKIWMILENSGDKSSVLWSEKIEPWVEKFWRKQKSMKSHEIACNLSMAILHCGDKMPDAFELLRDKIEEFIEKTNFHLIDVSRGLEEGRFKDILKYPDELLNLLDWNIPESTDDHDLGIGIFRSEIKKLLEKIKEKNPGIEKTDLYRNLYDRL